MPSSPKEYIGPCIIHSHSLVSNTESGPAHLRMDAQVFPGAQSQSEDFGGLSHLFSVCPH